MPLRPASPPLHIGSQCLSGCINPALGLHHAKCPNRVLDKPAQAESNNDQPKAVANETVRTSSEAIQTKPEPSINSVQTLQVVMMDGTSQSLDLPQGSASTVRTLKKAIEEASGGKIFVSEQVLIAGSEIMLDSRHVGDYGVDHGVSLVIQDPQDGGKTERTKLARIDAGSAMLALLQAMEDHAKDGCQHNCTVHEGLICKLTVEYEGCTSPDYNPYGPCGFCRSGAPSRSVNRYETQLQCSVALALNDESKSLKGLLRKPCLKKRR